MPKLPSHRNQSINLQSKSTDWFDWFLYDDNFGVNSQSIAIPRSNSFILDSLEEPYITAIDRSLHLKRKVSDLSYVRK